MKDFESFNLLMSLRSDCLPVEYNGDIYHYTSSSGFQSILFGDPFDAILWASRYDCLNDMSEGTVAEEILQLVSADLLKRNEISEEVHKLFSSVKTARTILLHRDVDGGIEFTRPECNRFVCSFSKNNDSLNMWNYYAKGNKYEGFNIGFHSSAIKETMACFFTGIEAAFHIYPVIYELEEQRRLMEGLLLKLRDNYSKTNEPRIRAIIANRLVDWGLIFKKDYFKHEEEIRIVIDIAKKETRILPRYRIYSGYTIPYIELKLEKEDLSFVSFGPLHNNNEQIKYQKEIMKEMLSLHGYHNVLVEHSKIPIRY